MDQPESFVNNIASNQNNMDTLDDTMSAVTSDIIVNSTNEVINDDQMSVIPVSEPVFKDYPQSFALVHKYPIPPQADDQVERKQNILNACFCEENREIIEAMEDINRIHPQVQTLLLKPQPKQKSPEWYAIRENMITASDVGSILGHNTYTSRNQLMKRKVNKEPFAGNAATRHGNKYENIIARVYEKRTNTQLLEFGLIQHDTYKFIGASPDGITLDGVMVEIKCPSKREIKDSYIPEYYYDQVQLQLEVCKLEKCDFIQCKILEYRNSYEFRNMFYDAKAERGILLEKLDRETMTEYFVYPPKLYDTLEEWDQWVDSHPDYSGIYFWYVDGSSIEHVPRDPMWMVNHYPAIFKFFLEFMDYKERGATIPTATRKSQSQVNDSQSQSHTPSKTLPTKLNVIKKQAKISSFFLDLKGVSDDETPKETMVVDDSLKDLIAEMEIKMETSAAKEKENKPEKKDYKPVKNLKKRETKSKLDKVTTSIEKTNTSKMYENNDIAKNNAAEMMSSQFLFEDSD